MAYFFEGASGIIFDCDGTLLDSMGIWNEVEAELVSRIGYELTASQMDEIRAAPINEGAALFHNRYGVGSSAQDVLDFIDSSLLQFYRTQVEPLPSARELLALLSDARIPCTVVTSSPRRYVQAGLERNGLLDYFRALVTTDEVGYAKSDTAIYLHALDLMNAHVESAWGVDDALYAVKSMNAAGLRTVGTYDCDETATFDDLQAHATIAVRSLEELL